MPQQDRPRLFLQVGPDHWRTPTVVRVIGGSVSQAEKPAQIHLETGSGIRLDIPLSQEALNQFQIYAEEVLLQTPKRK